jgi:hypothetical protein
VQGGLGPFAAHRPRRSEPQYRHQGKVPVVTHPPPDPSLVIATRRIRKTHHHQTLEGAKDCHPGSPGPSFIFATLISLSRCGSLTLNCLAYHSFSRS